MKHKNYIYFFLIYFLLLNQTGFSSNEVTTNSDLDNVNIDSEELTFELESDDDSLSQQNDPDEDTNVTNETSEDPTTFSSSQKHALPTHQPKTFIHHHHHNPGK